MPGRKPQVFGGRSRIYPDPFTCSGTGSYCSVLSMNTGLFRGIKCDPGCDLVVIGRLPAITVSGGIFFPISRSVFSLIVVVFLPDLDLLLLLDLRLPSVPCLGSPARVISCPCDLHGIHASYSL